MDNEHKTEEEKETPDEGLKKEDVEKTDQSTDEDADGGDVDKKEDEGEEVEDPYDKKLQELQKDNNQKSTALVQKNKKINDLKKELEEKGQVMTQAEVKALIDETMKPFETTKKELEEILQTTRETTLNQAIASKTANQGEAKIIRYFFDNEVNKELSFEKRLDQATVLAKNAISDPKFQQEVEKANSMGGPKGQVLENSVPLGPNETKLANALFKTNKGRQEFAKRLSNK